MERATVSPRILTGEEFAECNACHAQPGSPTLCAGCQHNRKVILRLKSEQYQRSLPPETKLDIADLAMVMYDGFAKVARLEAEMQEREIGAIQTWYETPEYVKAAWRYLAREFGKLPPTPIAMRLTCPDCGTLHIDEGEFATKPHHTHACQHCGMVWRPAIEATVGVKFLPGFKNA
jgi:predicted RNA-binding Zn-ribbon protein involved in translation (DUF1610 family)